MATQNFISKNINLMIDRLGMTIASYITPERVTGMTKNREYFEGMQKAPLKTKPGQANDNLIVNYIGLAVNRSTSMLMGGGVDFSVPGDEARDEWLKQVWKANKKNILLHRTGMDGEVFGTWYIKILPDAIETDDGTFPRLVLLDPQLMTIDTDPMDLERVTMYIFEIKMEDRAFREITRRSEEGNIIENPDGVSEPEPDGGWVVEQYENDGRSSIWRLISRVLWPYPFPPIIHCQNLPSLHSVYGMDGFAGGLDVQDKHNFVLSNDLKIIRYHAHPKTWASGMPAGVNTEKASWGADEMIKLSSPEARINNLEMQSDLTASRSIRNDLKQAIFELARVVDIASLKDKIGAITNFGLRVIYGDALSKNATRRELYGDALIELNRRMFLVSGFTDGTSEIHWGPDMPADEKEDADIIRQDLAAGLVSKETASTKRGYTWATSPDGTEEGEADKIMKEKTAEGAQANDALAALFAGTEVPQ